MQRIMALMEDLKTSEDGDDEAIKSLEKQEEESVEEHSDKPLNSDHTTSNHQEPEKTPNSLESSSERNGLANSKDKEITTMIQQPQTHNIDSTEVQLRQSDSKEGVKSSTSVAVTPNATNRNSLKRTRSNSSANNAKQQLKVKLLLFEIQVLNGFKMQKLKLLETAIKVAVGEMNVQLDFLFKEIKKITSIEALVLFARQIKRITEVLFLL